MKRSKLVTKGREKNWARNERCNNFDNVKKCFYNKWEKRKIEKEQKQRKKEKNTATFCFVDLKFYIYDSFVDMM